MTCPSPLVPANVDLTDFPFMPLLIARLKQSRAWLICKRRPELAFYMLNLWTASWHSRPAASLENDDDVLADIAMCPPEGWERIKADVLRGWVECDDGRLYHPVVAEQALSSWSKKVAQRQRTNAAREAAIQAKAAKRSAAAGSTPTPTATGNESREGASAVHPEGERIATESEHASRSGSAAVPARSSVTESVTEPATETVTESVTESKGQGESRDRENPPIVPRGDSPPAPSAKARTPKGADQGRGTRISVDWTLDVAGRAYAAEQGLTPAEIDTEAAGFRDYWLSVPGARGRKADWPATWRNRVRDVIGRRGRGRPIVVPNGTAMLPGLPGGAGARSTSGPSSARAGIAAAIALHRGDPH